MNSPVVASTVAMPYIGPGEACGVGDGHRGRDGVGEGVVPGIARGGGDPSSQRGPSSRGGIATLNGPGPRSKNHSSLFFGIRMPSSASRGPELGIVPASCCRAVAMACASLIGGAVIPGSSTQLGPSTDDGIALNQMCAPAWCVVTPAPHDEIASERLNAAPVIPASHARRGKHTRVLFMESDRIMCQSLRPLVGHARPRACH